MCFFLIKVNLLLEKPDQTTHNQGKTTKTYLFSIHSKVLTHSYHFQNIVKKKPIFHVYPLK